MKSDDDVELRRLCDLIAAADDALPKPSPSREALQKAALALHLVFSRGGRRDIEQQYSELGQELTDGQRSWLDRMGIDPS